MKSTEGIFKNKMMWLDENGNKVQTNQWMGNTIVMTMAYSQCRKTCPMLTIAKLKDLQQLFDEKSIFAEFVIISLDPENDTPAELSKYKKKINATRANWHFLSGSKENTREMANLLGLGDFLQMDDHILHGFKISIFNPKGEIDHILDWDHQDVKSVFAPK